MLADSGLPFLSQSAVHLAFDIPCGSVLGVEQGKGTL